MDYYEVREPTEVERIRQAIDDQTHALHTANLIALLAVECDHFDGPSAGLVESIRERLGLR